MNLRWYVKRYKYSTWDDRSDSWFHHTMTSDQKLQYQDGDEWKDVPVFEDTTDERVSEESV